MHGDCRWCTGDPFMPSAAENALQHIRDQYWARGYNDVRVTYQLTIDRIGGRAGVAFTDRRRAPGDRQGNPHRRQRQDQRTTGARADHRHSRTSRSTCRRSAARARTSTTAAPSRSSICRATPSVDTSRADSDGAGATDRAVEQATQRPVIVDVDGARSAAVSSSATARRTTRKASSAACSMHRCTTCSARRAYVGFSARYDAQIREGRVYMSQPTLLHWPIQTMASMYLPRGTQSRDADHRGVQRRSPRRVVPAGAQAQEHVRLELRLSLRALAHIRSDSGVDPEAVHQGVAAVRARSCAKHATRCSMPHAARSTRTRSRSRRNGWDPTTPT